MSTKVLQLNKRLAEWMGFEIIDNIDDPIHDHWLVRMADGSELEWDPCTDREQAYMLLRNVEKVATDLRVTQRNIINGLVADHFHKSYNECGARELWRLLTADPGKVSRAVYEHAVLKGGA